MDNESIPSESEFYLYPEEQDKYGLFVFFHSTRDITLSINFSYTAQRRPAFFMTWKFLLIFRGKNYGGSQVPCKNRDFFIVLATFLATFLYGYLLVNFS